METYTPGYSPLAAAFMLRRRLDPNGVFFLPHLKPGIAVLDCGCGPGTITRDIAKQVAPGKVTGVDFSAGQVAWAAQESAAQGIGNVEFRQANVYELPFADASFDAVFSHALLEHLKDPVAALVEVKRVLRPGGMLGVCTPDWGGFLLAPPSEELLVAFEAYKALQNRNGGDVYCGHKLGIYVARAGFEAVVMRSRYENYDPLTTIGDFLAVNHEEVGEPAHAATWREWGRQPGGMFSQAWVSCVGRKPTSPPALSA
ncbi:MAG TPA: methyltransferase domain-containing protein [Burkholderiales bacterium]|nr:methyltransferase domain-containing protein [Burkholderiales bacterium]